MSSAFHNGGQGNRLSLMVALSTLIGWVISGFGTRKAFLGVGLPMFGLTVYLLAGVFAMNNAVDANEAWLALQVQLKIGLMAFVTLTLVTSEKHIRVFGWVTLASIAYLAYVFNSQYIFDGYNRVWESSEAGLTSEYLAGSRQNADHQSRAPDPYQDVGDERVDQPGADVFWPLEGEDATLQQIGCEYPQQVQAQGQGECHASIRHASAHLGQYTGIPT